VINVINDVHIIFHAAEKLYIYICLIWCRIVRSRDVQFRVFSRPAGLWAGLSSCRLQVSEVRSVRSGNGQFKGCR